MSESHKCALCQDAFKTQRGYHIHYRVVHLNKANVKVEAIDEIPVSNKPGPRRVTWRSASKSKISADSRGREQHSANLARRRGYTADKSNDDHSSSEDEDQIAPAQESLRTRVSPRKLTPRSASKTLQQENKQLQTPAKRSNSVRAELFIPANSALQSQRLRSSPQPRQVRSREVTPARNVANTPASANRTSTLRKRMRQEQDFDQVVQRRLYELDREESKEQIQQMRQNGLKDETIEMVLQKELEQKKRKDETNRIICSQGYLRDKQIFTTLYTYLKYRFLEKPVFPYKELLNMYAGQNFQMGQFLHTANLKQNIIKINEWAGFPLLMLNKIGNVEHLRAEKSFSKMETKWMLEDKIRENYGLPPERRNASGFRISDSYFNKKTFDKMIEKDFKIQNEVADNLKSICHQALISIEYITSDEETEMTPGDWWQVEAYLPGTNIDALSLQDKTHIKKQFLRIKHEKKRVQKHNEKLERLVKCFSTCVMKYKRD